MSTKHQSFHLAQLTLRFEPALHTTLTNFFQGEKNQVLVQLIRQLVNQQGEGHLLIHGAFGTGKTHLLQGACLASQDSGIPSMYLPLEEIMTMPPSVLQGLDYLGLVCLDDIEAIGGQLEWENALLELCTRVKARAGRVLMASGKALADLSWKSEALTAYLKSSFMACPCYALSEQERVLLIEENAMLRGVIMGRAVAKFLVKQYSDDTAALLQSVAALEKLTAGTKCKLTLPLAKELLELY